VSEDLKLDVGAVAGEMAARIRAKDWSATALGPAEWWPQSLRTATSICVESGFPMLVCWGPELVMLYNDGYIPVLGAKHPNALGQPLLECWAEIRDMIGPMFRGVMETGRAVYANDLMFPLGRHGFTEECYFTFSYSPIREENDRVGGVLVTCIETTRRVLSERRMRTVRDLAARASQANTDAAAWRGAQEVLAQNPFGMPFVVLYSMDGSVARRVGLCGLQPDSPAAPERIDLHAAGSAWPVLLAASGKSEFVPDVRRRFGDIRGPVWPEPVESASVIPIARPALSRPYGFLIAGLSPRLHLDDEYRTFLTLVAEHIATAVANARAHEELVRSQHRTEMLADQARAAERRKDEFLAMLSHELRNPLAPIANAVQLMKLRGDGPPGREREVIERQVAHLSRLVDDLLDVSRIASGKFELRRRPMELAEALEKAVEIVSPLLEERCHDLRVELPRQGLRVHGDGVRLSQLFANLLTNAAKYTRQTGHIVVAAQREGEEIVVRVRDDGIGIRPELLPRIFDLFVQGGRGPDRTEGGLGLGLALVKSLVTLHGGSVTARSDGVDRGSEFVVRLPVLREAIAEENVASPALGARAASLKKRVMVVDDNRDAAEMLAEALRIEGHDVSVAHDGLEALSLIDEREFDVSILDLGLPLMDGYELAQRIRQDGRCATTRLIAVTGYGQENDVARARAVGFDLHLVKPVELQAILQAVESLHRA